MTKRDVAIWFCKVIALEGMASAGFAVARFGVTSMFVNWGYFSFSLLQPALSFGLYLFVWFFAHSIATELAAEGEHGPLISSHTELGPLLWRCVGLWLFLSASLNFGPAFFAWGYEQFFVSRPASNISSGYNLGNLIVSFLQSITGFFFAFTPRIRTFLGK